MKLLILHGPNMNLFGVRSAQKGEKLTLDKINKHIRRYIRDKNIEIKIIQTHNEVKAVSYIQKNRNIFDGLILTPSAWGKCGYILQDTLKLINLKYVIIKLNKNDNNNILSPEIEIYNDNIIISFKEAIDHFGE